MESFGLEKKRGWAELLTRSDEFLLIGKQPQMVRYLCGCCKSTLMPAPLALLPVRSFLFCSGWQLMFGFAVNTECIQADMLLRRQPLQYSIGYGISLLVQGIFTSLSSYEYKNPLVATSFGNIIHTRTHIQHRLVYISHHTTSNMVCT